MPLTPSASLISCKARLASSDLRNLAKGSGFISLLVDARQVWFLF